MKLLNNQDTQVGPGSYAFDVSGAMELQTDITGTFKTIKDGTFAGADNGVITFSPGKIKVINAGANVFTFVLVSSA